MKIIRYRKYNKDVDRNNYFREQLMLFLPWRDEEADIIQQNMEQKYSESNKIILKNYFKI